MILALCFVLASVIFFTLCLAIDAIKIAINEADIICAGFGLLFFGIAAFLSIILINIFSGLS